MSAARRSGWWFLAILLTFAPLALPAGAGEDDVPAQARDRVAAAEALEAEAADLLASPATARRALPIVLKALDAKQRALGRKHPRLGSAYLLLADASLVAAGQHGTDLATRAQFVPRDEAGRIIAIYRRAIHFLARRTPPPVRDITRAHVACAALYASFSMWPQQVREAWLAFDALHGEDLKPGDELWVQALRFGVGSPAAHSAQLDRLALHGRLADLWSLRSPALVHLDIVDADKGASPAARFEAIWFAVATLMGDPDPDAGEQVAKLLERAGGILDEAGDELPPARRDELVLLWGCHALDQGDLALYDARAKAAVDANTRGLPEWTVLKQRHEAAVAHFEAHRKALEEPPRRGATPRVLEQRLVQALSSVSARGTDEQLRYGPAPLRAFTLRKAKAASELARIPRDTGIDVAVAVAAHAHACFTAGLHYEAAEAYTIAIRFSGKPGKKSEKRLLAEIHTGAALLNVYRRSLQAALQHYDRAYDLYAGAKPPADRDALVCLINSAAVRLASGEAEAAFKDLDLVMTGLRKSEDLQAAVRAEWRTFEAFVGLLLDAGQDTDARFVAALLPAPNGYSSLSAGDAPYRDGDLAGAVEAERAQLRSYHEKMGLRFQGKPRIAGLDGSSRGIQNALRLLDYGAADESMAYLLEVLRVIESTADRTRSDTYERSLGSIMLRTYEGLAEAYALRGMSEKALSFAERALGLQNELETILDHRRAPPIDPVPGRTLALLALERVRLPEPHPDSRAAEIYARLLLNQGEADKALDVLEDALAKLKERRGWRESHARLAALLARVQLVRGELVAARTHIQTALYLLRGRDKADHPLAAAWLVTAGEIEAAANAAGHGREQFEQALSIADSALHPAHAVHAPALSGLALAFAAEGENARAVETMARALTRVEQHIEMHLSGATTSERVSIMASVHWILANWLEVTRRAKLHGYDAVLRLKARIGHSLRAETRALRGASGKSLETAEQLRAARRRLARLAYRVPRYGWQRLEWRRKTAEASADVARLTRHLRRMVKAYADADRQARPSLSAVSGALEKGEVFVDTIIAGGRYVVWIVAPGAEPVRIELGPEDAIDEQLQQFRDAVVEAEDAKDDLYLASGTRVRESIWEQITRRFPEGTDTVYAALDGPLGATPVEALPVGDGTTHVIDAIRLVRLASAGDLLARTSKVRGRGLLLVGGVDYNAIRPETDDAVVTGLDERQLNKRVPGLPVFDFLPGSVAEMQSVAKQWGRRGGAPVQLTEDTATESRVRADASGKEVLHLSTHGYVRESLDARLRVPADPLFRFRQGLEQHARRFDPLLVSGLALTGVNRRRAEHSDDGLLTALEVLELDLDGVSLAFLSACDTARGIQQAGEGTLGLVRAFRWAGARQVVASLWPVDDKATARLVELFYAAYLGDAKGDAAVALRTAARALRGEERFAAPRHWAAFGAYGRR